MSFVQATGVLFYVSLVAWLLFNSQNLFGSAPSFLIPLCVLLLFVVSAAITGLLVLGKPIQLYLNGLKKEAMVLLLITLAWLVIYIAVIAVVFLVK